MRRKKVCSFLLLLLACMLLLPPDSGAAEPAAAQTERVLLLYDSLGIGTKAEGNAAAMERLLAAYRAQVTSLSLEQYKRGMMGTYGKVIVVINAPDLAASNEAFLADIRTYKGGYVHIGENEPFRQADVHVPVFEKGIVNEARMAEVLGSWLDFKQPGQTFALVKDIYPFSDLQLLQNMADRLYDAGIPFIASVQPVFSNTDFPAMKRYLSALQYVQSRNGSIIVNAPVVQATPGLNGQTLQARMESFIAVLAENRIAPLGIGAELYWTYDTVFANSGMRFFDSAVLYPDVSPLHIERTNTSRTFVSSLYSVRLDDLAKMGKIGGQSQTFRTDTAVTFDFTDDKELLAKNLKALVGTRIAFDDYKEYRHEVRSGSHTIVSLNAAISIDGKMVHEQEGSDPVKDDYKYQEEVQKSFTTLFSVQNRIFIVIIAATLVVFGCFLLIGRRLYLRKFKIRG